MKIIQVHNYYQQQGGEAQVFRNEAELLRSKGHEIIQFTMNNNSIRGISKIKVATKGLWNFDSYKSIEKLIKENKPDVCHFHNIFPLISPSVYYACQKNQIPVIQTLHNYRLICPKATLFRDGHVCEDCVNKVFPWPAIFHSCYRDSFIQSSFVSNFLIFHRMLGTWINQVDLFITLSKFAMNKFIMAGFTESKMVINYNFVKNDIKGNEKEGSFALYVGRLSEEKGIRTLITAFSKIPEKRLVIIGDGPMLKEVQSMIKKKQITNISLLGRKNHTTVINYMKKCRFLVFPSECYEGLPLAVLESYSCQLPVIASRLGSMAEIIQDGETGLLFSPGDSNDLINKINYLWNQKDMLKKMGKSARSEYEINYSKETKYKELMEIYNRAINEKRKK